MFDRLVALIGKENLSKIKETRILLLGVGGVGGYVAEALIRSGIHELTIVDKDFVDETNLNRQIIALHSTIGRQKVDVLKERLEDINPTSKIEALSKNVEADRLNELNLESYDYVVDAVDDLKVKVALAKYALDKDVNLIISTGTAKKIDPSKLEMTTLDKTTYDPLARRMRSSLKGYPTDKLVVLASSERPIETDDNVLGSTAFVPSSAGLLIASHIIKDIIKQ